MPSIIVGIDEVGRGCLFGPVVSSAVVLNEACAPEGLTDSKKLSPKKRKEISSKLLTSGKHKVSIGESTPKEIDQINILQASLLSMKRAFEDLGFDEKDYEDIEIRVDGNQKIPGLDPRLKQVTIIKGDLKDKAIAAASIVAKVFRDELVVDLDKEFPGYGLSGHKGYPTKIHKEAILKLGVTSEHRRSFKGVLEAL